MTFDEDRCRTRKDASALNFAIIPRRRHVPRLHAPKAPQSLHRPSVPNKAVLTLRFRISPWGMALPNWPMPRVPGNHGNFVGSLWRVARSLAKCAASLGVEIYPGFAAGEALFGADGEMVGVATGDMGVGRDGRPKSNFTRGTELRGKYTLLAEGMRRSLTKRIVERFKLDEGRHPQKYGIGLKELWQINPNPYRAGPMQHTLSWPLTAGASGRSLLHHCDDNLVSKGGAARPDQRRASRRRRAGVRVGSGAGASGRRRRAPGRFVLHHWQHFEIFSGALAPNRCRDSARQTRGWVNETGW